MSKTVQEFWQRWHITLGGWLKSYVMYPLLKTKALVNLGARCKNRFGKQGKKIPSYIAMLAVWFLMGLWHGNSWKFVFLGLWFWLVIVMGQICEPLFKNIKKMLHTNDNNIMWKGFQVCRTIALVNIGMIFFNAASLSSAIYMVKNIFRKTDILIPASRIYKNFWMSGSGKLDLILLVLFIAMQILKHIRIKVLRIQLKNIRQSLDGYFIMGCFI